MAMSSSSDIYNSNHEGSLCLLLNVNRNVPAENSALETGV